MASLFQIHEPGETPDPHAGDVAVGIDLGTTHSVIALADGGRATVLADAEGRRLVPSVVHYGTDGGVTVGSHAAEKQKRGDTNTVASIKRLMGRGAGDEAARTFSHSSVPGDGPLRLKIAGKIRTPIEISADILRHLKAQAEAALAKPVTRSVITVPAYFDDAARQATKDAARLAGLDVLRLINEPTAAALAYGLDSGAEGIYAVYDLGGGTFDISILKLTAGVFQVLATGGDRALGGDDIDAAILAHWQAQGKTPEGDGKRAARSVKEDLSEQDEAGEGDCRLTQAELNALAEPFIARTLRLSESALVDASVTNDDLQGFVLVGGSTRLASVRMATEAFFGRAAVTGIDPDEVVAVGAAIQAEGLTRGSDNLLLDVVPLSLGLETMGGLCEKIIHRNTPIPTAVAQEFTTYRDGQDGMLIHIVQGEREMADQNRSLARFELSGIPPMVAGIARIAVRFEVDADGLLQVSAREETTGTEQKIVVKPSYGLDDGAIERMLLESMQYAREDITERLLREARVDAERSLDEVRSAFARDATLIEPEEREKIEAQMAELERVMRLEKREIIDEEREQLHTLTRPFAERRMDKAIRGALAGLHVDDAAKA